MIDWQNIEALSFDCYGTLIDWEHGILAALQPWVSRFGDATVLSAFGAVEPHIEHAHPSWPYRLIIAEVYRQMAAKFDMPVDDDQALGFAISIGTWPPFDDSRAALKLLKRRFKLFILSNIDETSISGTLAQLETDFDGVFTAEAIGSYKPNAQNFQYLIDAVERRGINRSKLVHVAQSLFHDHVPAQAAGLKTIWVDRNGGKAGAARLPDPLPHFDARVADLNGLVAHIEQGGVRLSANGSDQSIG
jgi:2-haloacid dehalogenase